VNAVIVATMWDHVEVVGAVDPAAPPTQGELDAIADRMTRENCGVRPVVRVLEEFALPAFEDSGEPVCEDRYRRLKDVREPMPTMKQEARTGALACRRGCRTNLARWRNLQRVPSCPAVAGRQ
jgi:hypothetical protein